jgi:hypothetical protein
MASDVLGTTVHADVSSEVKRLLEVRSLESIVDDKDNIFLLADF